MAAIEATLDVSAERLRATVGQVAESATLLGAEDAAVLRQEDLAVCSNHIRHFPRRPLGADGIAHARPSGPEGEDGGTQAGGRSVTPSRSSRLGS